MSEYEIADALYSKLWNCFEREDYDSGLQAATNLLVDILCCGDKPFALAEEMARKLPGMVQLKRNLFKLGNTND